MISQVPPPIHRSYPTTVRVGFAENAVTRRADVSDMTFELRERPVWPVGFASLVALGIMVFSIRGGDGAAALTTGIVAFVTACQVIHSGLWQIRSVTIEDTGVVLEARVRRISIAWTDLRSVVLGAGYRIGGRMNWVLAGGRVVKTPAAFSNVHRMLTELERRAPHMQVAS
jgi:hypothetical protein